MKVNATFSQIANQLVTIFRNEGKTASYNSANEMREVFCGWCGPMSPMSRPAFVADFGADVVEEAEKEAHGYYERVEVTDELAAKLQKASGLSHRELFDGYRWTTANSIARTICDNTEYTDPEEKGAAPEQPEARADGLEIVDYSEKAVAVTGDTRAHAYKLKELGGRFNARLKCGAGWIFSKKKEQEIRLAFGL